MNNSLFAQIAQWKKISRHKKGNWHRSPFWTAIRLAAAIAIKNRQTYKMLMNLYCAWLVRFWDPPKDGEIQVKADDDVENILNKDVQISWKIEMLRVVQKKMTKIVANSNGENITLAVLSKISDYVEISSKDIKNSAKLRIKPDDFIFSSIPIENATFDFQISDLDILRKLQPDKNLCHTKDAMLELPLPHQWIESYRVNAKVSMQSAITSISNNKFSTSNITELTLIHRLLHGAEKYIFEITKHCLSNDVWEKPDGTLMLEFFDAYITLLKNANLHDDPHQASRSALLGFCLTALMDQIVRNKYECLTGTKVAIPKDILEALYLPEREEMDTANQISKYISIVGGDVFGLFDPRDSNSKKTFDIAAKIISNDSGFKTARQYADKLYKKYKEEFEKAKAEQLEIQKHDVTSCKTSGCIICSEKSGKAPVRKPVFSKPLPEKKHDAKILYFFLTLGTTNSILQEFGGVVGLAFYLLTNMNNLKHFKFTKGSENYYDIVQECPDWINTIEFGAQQKIAILLEISNRNFQKTRSVNMDVIANEIPDSTNYSCIFKFHGALYFRLEDFTKYHSAKFQLDTKDHLFDLTKNLQCDNAVLAEANYTPNNLFLKPEFIKYGFLSQNPEIILLRLMDILQDVRFPLEYNSSRTIVQNALYTIGPISPGDKFPWKRKVVLSSKDWVSHFAEIIEARIDLISNNWQLHQALQLILDVSVYVQQFDDGSVFTKVLNKCYVIFNQWINELKQLQNTINQTQKETQECRYRILLFSGYAILAAHFSGTINTKVVELRRQMFEYMHLLNSSEDTIDHVAKGLIFYVDDVLYSNSRLLQMINSDHSILTNILANVFPDEDFSNITWATRSGFYKTKVRKNTYILNPINGLLLKNELSVMELPSEISSSVPFKYVF